MIVMVKVWLGPGQPLRMGVTVRLATSCAETGAATKLRLPVPEAAKPMARLALAQEKLAPAVPLNGTLTNCRHRL